MAIRTVRCGPIDPRHTRCDIAGREPMTPKIKIINARKRSSFNKGQHSHELMYGRFRPSPHAFSADPQSPRGVAEKAGPPAPDRSRRHPLKHCTRGDAAIAARRTGPRLRFVSPEIPTG